MKWNGELVEKLLKLNARGRTYSEMSEVLVTTKDSVRGKLYKLGVKYTPNKEVTKKTLACKNPNCNKKFTDYIKRKRVFCSHSCSASFNNIGVRRIGQEPKNCKNCGDKTSTSCTIYCSNLCQFEFQYNKRIENWKAGNCRGYNTGGGIKSYIRRYMMNRADNMCSQCSWSEINTYTGLIPLHVDHIDGDYRNNDETHLRVLCPNCHSLTSTFGSRNKGRGREGRQAWRQKQRSNA